MSGVKRFENWNEVDCNDCDHWWDSSCDGTPKGSTKLCNSFQATRRVDIPRQLQSLRTALKWLIVMTLLLWVLTIVLIVGGC